MAETLSAAQRFALAAAASLSLLLGPCPVLADEAYSVAAYEERVAAAHGEDGVNYSLFTDDAREAMERLKRYVEYVEGLAGEEEACGASCADNRETLERAWQVVANEHFNAYGAFSQAGWADQLLRTLQDHGGLLATKQQLYSAVSQLLASLHDPYSEFLPPSAFRRAIRRPLPSEESYYRAQYVGLGLELGPPAPGGGRLVLAPLAGSPAEEAGIRRGDRLLSIDGVPLDQLGMQQLAGIMRGPAGSLATLEWVPGEADPSRPMGQSPFPGALLEASKPLTSGGNGGGGGLPAGSTATVATAAAGCGGAACAGGAGGGGAVVGVGAAAAAGVRKVADLERRPLPQPAVQVSQLSLGDGRWATYVRVLYWGSESTAGLADTLRRFEPLAGNVGYVLDLRNNPGGVFEDAISAATFFLRRGDVVARTIRGPEDVVDTVWQVGSLPAEAFPPEELPGRLADKPVVLLTNRSTASASEVFAGALRDNGRAPILGEETFGKGLVQYYFPLNSGVDGGLRVTVAKYQTPSGYDMSSTRAGLPPDRTCSDFPHGELPTDARDARSADECVREAARMLVQGRATGAAAKAAARG